VVTAEWATRARGLQIMADAGRLAGPAR
jgi:hypothetical protein